jgi:hypothetical protein
VIRGDRNFDDVTIQEEVPGSLGQGTIGFDSNSQALQLGSSTAQGVTEQVVYGQKGLDKVLYFCCDLNGHYAQDCTDVLCVYCESETHVAADCPLLFDA